MQTAIINLKVLVAVLSVALVVMMFVIGTLKQYQGLPFFRHDSEWQGRKIALANWIAKHKMWRYIGPVAGTLALATIALSFLMG